MRAVDQVANANMDKLTPPHCFELVTKELTYYMGMEIPGNGKARNKMMKTLQSMFHLVALTICVYSILISLFVIY